MKLVFNCCVVKLIAEFHLRELLAVGNAYVTVLIYLLVLYLVITECFPHKKTPFCYCPFLSPPLMLVKRDYH
jgi:hypothetical protein